MNTWSSYLTWHTISSKQFYKPWFQLILNRHHPQTYNSHLILNLQPMASAWNSKLIINIISLALWILVRSPMSSKVKWFKFSTFIFYSIMVVLERVKPVLPMKAIRQMTIMLKHIQLCIVWPHGATLKRGEVISFLEKPDFWCNISFNGNGLVECLTVSKLAKSWAACKTQEVTLPQRAYVFKNVGSSKEAERCKYWSRRSKILQKLKQKNKEIKKSHGIFDSF